MKNKILNLAIPSIIENILQIMLSTVDTYFVSTLGSVAISAVGLNGLISNIFLTFFIAVGTGVSILTARADGEENQKKVNHCIHNGLTITIGLSMLFLLVNVLGGQHILNLIGKKEGISTDALIYFNIVIVPIIFLALMTVLSSIIKSLGDTKTPMYTAFVINIVNVLLDALLIPSLGIFGVGLATTVSRALGALALIYVLNKKTGFLKSFTVKIGKDIGEMIGYAIPVGLEKIVMRIGQLIYGSLIIKIGLAHYTGHQIAGTIEQYSYLPAMGFGVAAFTIIGHAIGAKEYDDIKRAGKLTFRFATVMMLIIGFVFFVFAPNLAKIFTDDPEVIRLVVTVLRIIACFQPFLASTQVLASSLQALGDVKYPLYLTTIGIWFIRILGTYIFGLKLGYGLIGVWSAYAFDITFRGSLLYLRFRSKTKSTEILERRYHVASK